MAGPLHWFRKNQKLMLAVSGVGLMFVFTLSPLVDWFTGGGSPGVGSARSQESIAVQWNGGELREGQLEQLQIGRNLLRRFLLTLRQIASERGGVQRVTMLPLYTSDRSLLELELLAAEAEKLGIEVGDKAVLDYLKQLADGTVSASEYGQLLRTSTGSNLSETQLLDLMTRELKAQKVRAMVQSGGYPASPIAAWDYYNRLNRFVKAEMLPISVDDYLGQIEEPNEVAVVELYDKHKDDYPFPLSPEPGFRRREQRAFQYVKVDYDAILEVEQATVTDDEVKQYYEENKEQYRKDSPSDLDLEVDDAPATPGDGSAEEAATSSVEGAEPSSDGVAAPDTEASATENAPAPDAGKTADGTTAEAADPPSDAAADVENTEPQDAPAETEAPQPNSDPDPSPTALPQEDEDDPSQEDAAAEPPIAESAEETEAEETDATAADRDTEAVDVVDTTEEEVATETEVVTVADEEPAVAASVDDAVETATEPTTEPTTTEEGETEEPAAATTVEPSDLDLVVSDEPIYEALEDVADDIRQTIARPRAQAKMNAVINEVKRELGKYHDAYAIWDIELETNPDATKPTPPVASAFADGDQVVVGDIPLIDPLQAEDFEIGRAFDLRFPQTGVQRVMFAETAFSDKASLYNPQVIPDIDVATNRFVYWVTDVKEEYAPELDEVRPEVVRALKRQQAVGLALEDAKTLAKKARQQNARLSESLSDRENTEFIDTGEISWVTPPMMEGSTPRIGVIPGAEDASPELRETLFRLAPGEVGYATNMPKNKVYIFRVEEVNPTTELRREQFLRSGVDAPVLFLARRDSFVGLSEWYRDFTDQNGVQWKRDPRAGEGGQL